jgi:F-type H+-transporting ATPase subunit a
MEHEFSFALGPLVIDISIITTWGIMLVITALAWLSTRHLELLPGSLQTTVEGIVAVIDEAISAVAPEHGRQIMPFIASLWLFLIIANLVGLIPGLHSPTRDLSVTSALAVLVFFSVH